MTYATDPTNAPADTEQELPSANSQQIQEGTIRVTVEFHPNQKEQALKLVRAGLRNRFFTFDERDDIKQVGENRYEITAKNEQFLAPKEEQQ